MHRLWTSSLLVVALVSAAVRPGHAQTAEREILRVSLPVGRSYPIHTNVPVTRVSVATPTVADVVVIGERDLVINARAAGETDVIMWTGAERRHYRILVNPPTDRRQVSLGIIFAEVRKDALYQLGLSALYRDRHVRAGTGVFGNDAQINPTTGQATVPTTSQYATVLTNFGLNDVLAIIEAEESKGNARLLARPNLLAANRTEGNFLAGGEIPVPIAQPAQGGQTFVTITYREFGIRLRFTPEILSDSLITLAVTPEVSTLDYTNAVTIAGFRVPALQTRRVATTVDVQPNQSLVISGLMSENRERVRSGIPLLMDIPILGSLFSSSRWQNSETELLVIVTPTIVDPLRPRARDLLRVLPDTTLPAREVLEGATTPVLPPSPRPRTP
ncbi:MAG TPA: pilus assembly protein N-terminal domain-containing protein [Gemmatimonadaceae bacterium]|jgi:pilus assembly protein CpaC|nr:pilus assembly protein N-terminal domain-containing protein [Gemmatimonadaceae bacterium]